MSRFIVVLVSLLFAAPALAAGIADVKDRRRLADDRGALYYAYQGDWFEALVLLDARPAGSRGLDASQVEARSRRTGSEMGFFELEYRMYQRAGRAMKAVIEGAVQDGPRNEALFHLARMYYRKDQPEEALHAVERIRGNLPAEIRSDVAFLRANIAMAVGRNAEAAAILRDVQSEKRLEGFNSYNLGIALLRAGDERQGREYLDRTGRLQNDDRAVLAIKDKANLVLGEQLLNERHFDAAKGVLDRVRLSGPFSNRALLSSGWADASLDRYEKALVPWSILAGREVADPAVQEAMLAVPYAYGKLGVYSTAALKYEAALEAFGKEIGKLDASIAAINEGALVKSLAREELNRDADVIVNLRELPKTPETFYLLDLMISKDFQESMKNYLDLEQLRKKLDAWSGDLVAFEDILRQRRAHYEPLLPAIDREFTRLESEMRLRTEQRDRIAQQLEAMQAQPRPDLLVTADEHVMSGQVARLEKFVTPRSEEVARTLCERIRRLRGALVWKMYAEYDQRLDDVRKHLLELDRELDELKRRHGAFARTRRTAIESYQGYVDVMRRRRQGIASTREKALALMARQGRMLEIMAVNKLTRRRDRLEELRIKARFALADSYDRAKESRVPRGDPQ